MQTCVECGAQVPKLIGGSCPACFVKKEPLLVVPEVLDVELCAHCDARHIGSHWFDPDEGVPLSHIREEALRGAVKVHPLVRSPEVQVKERTMDERNFEHSVTLQGDVEGVPVEGSAKALVRMRKSVCDRCSRMFGGYYAAVIQLRGTARDARPEEVKRAHKIIGDELDRLRAAGNRQAFLTKSGPVPGGFDYYIGDIEAARILSKQVASRLAATVQETAKLAGRKEGEDIYRVTFLVRIALYSAGDFARRGEEGLVQVLQIDRGKVLIYDMATHRRDKIPEEELRRLGGPELLKEAVLVSQDAGNFQVLDPVSLLTVDLPRPEGYITEGGTIWVLRHEERLFVPPVLPAHLR
jgi:nonsense-mediated mRNA decay protein 3